MRILVQFLIGLLFGIGLVIAGMSNPAKVLNFLDIAAIAKGTWDPSLAFVMGGGVIVAFIGYRLVWKRSAPLFDTQFHIPKVKDIDAPIIVGPALFGVGWGLGGFCPGPAFTALGAGHPSAVMFVIAMIVGMIAARLLALKSNGATTAAVKA
jgi:uncharacterized membrane protein YedE/YeeE